MGLPGSAAALSGLSAVGPEAIRVQSRSTVVMPACWTSMPAASRLGSCRLRTREVGSDRRSCAANITKFIAGPS